MAQTYLKPNAKTPTMLRDHKNGQFVNPPLYMTWGGMSSSRKLQLGSLHDATMSLEKRPKARGGNII